MGEKSHQSGQRKDDEATQAVDNIGECGLDDVRTDAVNKVKFES